MGRTACTEPQCLYKGALYLTVELYLYSPCGPYGLYRDSVPVISVQIRLFWVTSFDISRRKLILSVLCLFWLISVYYYTNICTNKWCKIYIKATATCFGVNTPSSGNLQVLSSIVMNHWNYFTIKTDWCIVTINYENNQQDATTVYSRI